MSTFPFWIITADSQNATLFSGIRTRTGGVQLDQVRVLRNSHADFPLRQRPSVKASSELRFGRSPEYAAQMQLETYNQSADMELLQFVHEIKIWLTRAGNELDVRDAILLGSPRVFELLVAHLSNIDINIEFRGGGLKDLSLQDIDEKYSLQAV